MDCRHQGVRCLLLLLLAAAASAQVDVRALVRQSIRNGAASWRRSCDYFCTEDDTDRRFDSHGHIRAVDDDVYDIVPLGYGASYQMHVRHDNEPVPRDEQIKEQGELTHLKAASPAVKERRFVKVEAGRSYMQEVADAFDFKILGGQDFPTGPAWVIQATRIPATRRNPATLACFHLCGERCGSTRKMCSG